MKSPARPLEAPPSPPLPDADLDPGPAVHASLPSLLAQGTFEHYEDADLYDHEYRRRRDDIRWYRNLAAQVASERASDEARLPLQILELGCGTGRLLVPLARDGHQVVGVDRSATMLARCQVRLGRAGRQAAARAQLIRADFCRLPLADQSEAKKGAAGHGSTVADDIPSARRFALVLCPFNGFMHLYTRTDVERFLGEVRRVLRPDGVLAFDVTNPDPIWLGRDPTRRWARTRFRHPRTGARLVYSSSHVYDPETQIAWIRLFYELAEPPTDLSSPAENPPSGFPRTVMLAHRQFFPAELEALLHYAGFELIFRAGGFDGQPLSIVSSEQVICARMR